MNEREIGRKAEVDRIIDVTRRMASRVNAHFVIDEEKMRNFASVGTMPANSSDEHQSSSEPSNPSLKDGNS